MLNQFRKHNFLVRILFYTILFHFILSTLYEAAKTRPSVAQTSQNMQKNSKVSSNAISTRKQKQDFSSSKKKQLKGIGNLMKKKHSNSSAETISAQKINEKPIKKSVSPTLNQKKTLSSSKKKQLKGVGNLMKKKNFAKKGENQTTKVSKNIHNLTQKPTIVQKSLSKSRTKIQMKHLNITKSKERKINRENDPRTVTIESADVMLPMREAARLQKNKLAQIKDLRLASEVREQLKDSFDECEDLDDDLEDDGGINGWISECLRQIFEYRLFCNLAGRNHRCDRRLKSFSQKCSMKVKNKKKRTLTQRLLLPADYQCFKEFLWANEECYEEDLDMDDEDEEMEGCEDRLKDFKHDCKDDLEKYLKEECYYMMLRDEK